MKKLIYTLVMGGLLIASCESKKNADNSHESHQPAATSAEQSNNSKKSIPSETHGNVGEVHISINYHSPAARGRVIWGGLVPHGEVWVAGAHTATSVEFSKAIEVEGTVIPEGKYAFFTIPGQEKWTLILYKIWEQPLADDYDQADDVIRVYGRGEDFIPNGPYRIYAADIAGIYRNAF